MKGIQGAMLAYRPRAGAGNTGLSTHDIEDAGPSPLKQKIPEIPAACLMHKPLPGHLIPVSSKATKYRVGVREPSFQEVVSS